MPDAQNELNYIQAGIAALDNYLLSSEIYWTLQDSPRAGGQEYPSLTLGGLLLALARLNSNQLSSELQARRDHLRSDIEAMQSRWRVAWEKKAVREFHARLYLWRDYLEEYRLNTENNADRYAYEVRRRVMLQLLEPFARDAPPTEIEMLRGLDLVLQGAFIPGKFIWEDWLESAFPARPYWYLYGHLRDK